MKGKKAAVDAAAVIDLKTIISLIAEKLMLNLTEHQLFYMSLRKT